MALASPSAANAAALADLFTDDAVADYGFLGTFTGRAQLLHAFENVLPTATRWSIHYAQNPELTANGDDAEGSWAFLVHAIPRTPPDAPQATYFGRYSEKYRRENGVWKFSQIIATFASP